MLNLVEYEKSFITSGPGYSRLILFVTRTLCACSMQLYRENYAYKGKRHCTSLNPTFFENQPSGSFAGSLLMLVSLSLDPMGIHYPSLLKE